MKTDDIENFIVGIELHPSRPDSGQREKIQLSEIYEAGRVKDVSGNGTSELNNKRSKRFYFLLTKSITQSYSVFGATTISLSVKKSQQACY